MVSTLNAKMVESVTRTRMEVRSIAHARQTLLDSTAKVNVQCIVSFKALHTCVTKQISSVPNYLVGFMIIREL